MSDFEDVVAAVAIVTMRTSTRRVGDVICSAAKCLACCAGKDCWRVPMMRRMLVRCRRTIGNGASFNKPFGTLCAISICKSRDRIRCK